MPSRTVLARVIPNFVVFLFLEKFNKELILAIEGQQEHLAGASLNQVEG